MPHWHRQQLSLDLSCLGFLDGQHCYTPNTLVVDQTLVCRSLFPHIQLQQPEHVIHTMLDRTSDWFCCVTLESRRMGHLFAIISVHLL